MKRSQKEPAEILERRKVESNKIIDTDSLVAKYEVLMKEHEAKLMSEERSILLFQVLDNLIPHLGVFKPILSKVREELYEYVFSDEHHTVRASRMTNISGSRSQTSASNRVDRVPHYLLMKKLLQSRDNNADNLQEQIDTLQESLFTKQVEFEEALATVAARNKENQSLQDRVTELESALHKREIVIRKLSEELEHLKHDYQEVLEDLNRQCDQLQAECNDKEDDIAYLSSFKAGYDELDEAFLERATVLPSPEVNRHNSYIPKDSAVATKKEHIVSDIQASKKLEEQVLTVMNTIIEQYDQFLEAQKSELETKQLMNNTDIIETRKIEREIDQADQELWTIQERFKSSMEDINEELKLLRQHYMMLEEQLATLEDEQKKKSKPSEIKRKKKRVPDKAPDDPITLDEIKGMSLNPDDYSNEEYEEDQFVPHERIFSKYSVMLYYSQDAGKNYYIHQDCKYCESCHEKTIACPHKVLGESKIILMPHKVTHIKLKRPSVKIVKQSEDDIHPPPSAGTAIPFTKMSATKRSAGARSDRTSAVESGKFSSATAGSVNSGTKVIQMKNPLEIVWDDYRIRTDMERTIGRSLTLARTFSCYEQFQAFTAWQDEYASEEEGYGSVLDNLYQYFGDKYLKEEAQYAAAHDFLAAVIQHSKDHRQLQLFGHALAGNVDFTACRYILLLSNYIESIDWQDVEDFRAFSACVYSFIPDEDIESLQMGYVSFSENKISKLHVFEYIMYLTLKGREPRIQDLEHQLMQYPSREAGLMNDDEFSEAADHLLQVPDEKLRKAFFSETLLLIQNTQPDVFHVHVSKLASILAYLQLREQCSKLDATIHEYIAENRPTHEENLGVHGHVVPVDPDIHLLTMEKVMNLSYNVARRDRCRKDRLAFEADFM